MIYLFLLLVGIFIFFLLHLAIIDIHKSFKGGIVGANKAPTKNTSNETESMKETTKDKTYI